MKFTVIALLFTSPFVNATAIGVADVMQANVNLDVHSSTCLLGFTPEQNGTLDIGLMTGVGEAIMQYPSSSANGVWGIENTNQLVYRMGTSSVNFTFDSNLKITTAALKSQAAPPVDCGVLSN